MIDMIRMEYVQYRLDYKLMARARFRIDRDENNQKEIGLEQIGIQVGALRDNN